MFPGGEPFGEFRLRVLGALATIDGPAVVVSHAGVIRTALAHWLAIPDEALFRIDVGYGGVSVVDRLNGTPVVRVVNGRRPAWLGPGELPEVRKDARILGGVARAAIVPDRHDRGPRHATEYTSVLSHLRRLTRPEPGSLAAPPTTRTTGDPSSRSTTLTPP